MNTNKTGSITSILEKRLPLAEKIAGVEAELKSLDRALQHLQKHRNQLLTRVDDSNVAELLTEINLVTLHLSINTEIEALVKLKERFCRQTLNIGVIGRAKQGKSQILQSLTGLSAAEIPNGDGHWKFPHADVGQIAFVELPSLGDSGVCDQQNLMKILGQQIDAILFVRMPQSTGDYWTDADIRLYETVRTAQIDVPINLWSFMILNRTEADSPFHDNSKSCQDLAQDLVNKNINVVECITANCASTQEAHKVLNRVLDYLHSTIVGLDYKYAFLCQQRLIVLQSRVNAELEKVHKALDLATHDDIQGLALFEIKFQKIWSDLTNSLEKLLLEQRKKREAVDPDLQKQIEAVFQACRSDTRIPSILEIEQRFYLEKSYVVVYEKYLNEIRAHLSRHLLLLDSSLQRSLDKVKLQVAEILMSKGCLARLTQAQGTDFIAAIAAQIPDELIPGIPSQIKYGFQTLAEFQLSYRGLLQHRIRQHLDGLTPNEPTTLKLTTSPSAEQVLLNLKIAYAETVGKSEKALKQLLCEPNQAIYGIIEEFIDCILRSQDVESEWRIFLQEMREQIWQEEFQQPGNHRTEHNALSSEINRTQIRREVLNSVQQATAANQSELMHFLK